jgi:hypothetical protein
MDIGYPVAKHIEALHAGAEGPADTRDWNIATVMNEWSGNLRRTNVTPATLPPVPPLRPCTARFTSDRHLCKLAQAGIDIHVLPTLCVIWSYSL